MANSFVNLVVHVIFSTKNRDPWLSMPERDRVFAYLGGIAKADGMAALSIGGTADHVHLLLSMPSKISLADAVQRLKGGSSLWIHETFRRMGGFAWQEGYGAFSLAQSQVEEIGQYIARQEEHHRTVSFRDEYLAYLKAVNMQFEEKYVLG